MKKKYEDIYQAIKNAVSAVEDIEYEVDDLDDNDTDYDEFQTCVSLSRHQLDADFALGKITQEIYNYIDDMLIKFEKITGE
jgi:hypothetical protein